MPKVHAGAPGLDAYGANVLRTQLVRHHALQSGVARRIEGLFTRCWLLQHCAAGGHTPQAAPGLLLQPIHCPCCSAKLTCGNAAVLTLAAALSSALLAADGHTAHAPHVLQSSARGPAAQLAGTPLAIAKSTETSLRQDSRNNSTSDEAGPSRPCVVRAASIVILSDCESLLCARLRLY